MSDLINSPTQLAHFASDLQDTEAADVARIIVAASRKYSTRLATVENLDAMRDEILTRLADINILATVDVAPILNGEPPVVEIIGKVAGDDQHKYGMDHDRKKFEVQAANRRGEEFYGQKGEEDGKARARARRETMRQLRANEAD